MKNTQNIYIALKNTCQHNFNQMNYKYCMSAHTTTLECHNNKKKTMYATKAPQNAVINIITGYMKVQSCSVLAVPYNVLK